MGFLLFIAGLFRPAVAFAVDPAQDPCATLPGGCAAGNPLLILIPRVGQLFVGLAAGGAVLFTVVGGAFMLLSFGDDSKISRGRNSILYALGGFALALASQAIVTYVHTTAVAQGLATAGLPTLNTMRAAVSVMLSLMNITFVIVTIYAGYQMVIARGKPEEFGKGRTIIIWAIAGAMIINVAHALVRAVLRLGF